MTKEKPALKYGKRYKCPVCKKIHDQDKDALECCQF